MMPDSKHSGSTDLRHPPGFRGIVIGVSAGGMNALLNLLPALPKGFSLPIVVVQHRLTGSDDFLARNLNRLSEIQVKEAEDKEPLKAGSAYLAPADYHVLVERDHSLSLSVDPKVHYSRPSIDVLFESAAYAWSAGAIGVILTGANADGAEGLARIKQTGGTTIVQDPKSAEYDMMPRAAIAAASVDYVLTVSKIGSLLAKLGASAQ